MAKPATPQVSQPESNIAGLKEKARQFKSFLNAQYRENIAYNPSTSEIAKVSVSRWLEMGEAFKEATRLPGLPFGNIVHIYGKPDTGKTTTLMEAIAKAQQQGILPILILTEHKFDFHRLSEFMGADPEAMVVLHAENIEQAYGFMEKILRELPSGKLTFEVPVEGKDEPEQMVVDMTNQACYLMFDSIGNTMTETEMEYEIQDWDKSMGKHAKALKTLTKRINNLLSKVRDKCGILLLNQSYQSMPSYGPSVETPYGGDGVPYSCVLNIRMRRIGDLKMTVKGQEIIIGRKTQIEIKKNHISHLMPITEVYTVGTGLVLATEAELTKYKKLLK